MNGREFRHVQNLSFQFFLGQFPLDGKPLNYFILFDFVPGRKDEHKELKKGRYNHAAFASLTRGLEGYPLS